MLSTVALINNINILKDCVRVVTLNNPPNIPIPFSNALICILLYAIKEAKRNVFITILENNIDLSRFIVRALETSKNINKNVNNFFLFISILIYLRLG